MYGAASKVLMGFAGIQVMKGSWLALSIGVRILATAVQRFFADSSNG